MWECRKREEGEAEVEIAGKRQEVGVGRWFVERGEEEKKIKNRQRGGQRGREWKNKGQSGRRR